jgi:hypothetical protein
MTRQVEYRLTADEIHDALREYVQNVKGDIDPISTTVWVDVPNSADQETAYAVVRSGKHE